MIVTESELRSDGPGSPVLHDVVRRVALPPRRSSLLWDRHHHHHHHRYCRLITVRHTPSNKAARWSEKYQWLFVGRDQAAFDEYQFHYHGCGADEVRTRDSQYPKCDSYNVAILAVSRMSHDAAVVVAGVEVVGRKGGTDGVLPRPLIHRRYIERTFHCRYYR